MFLKSLIKLFDVRCYAAADDKLVPPGTVSTSNSAALVAAGQLSTGKIKNLLGVIDLPFNDSVSPRHQLDVIFCRTTPQGDATYAVLPLGTIAIQAVITSSAVSSVELWLKKYAGANGWTKIIAGSDTTSTSISVASTELANIRGTSTAATGTFRGINVRTTYGGAGTGDGEAVRAFASVTAASTVASIHGAHVTASVGTGGSVAGALTGLRATIANAIAVTAGTHAALRLDTDFVGAVSGAATSFIYACDANTYGADSFIRLGTIATRNTTKTTLAAGAYSYVSGKMTFAAAGVSGALKVVTPDGTFFIPLYLQGDVS